MRALCFATGNLYRAIGKENIFKTISQLNVDGIELTLGADFVQRLPSESDERFFKNYSLNSIHSPRNFSLEFVSQKEMIVGLDILEDYSKRLQSKSIILHPTQILPKNFLKYSQLNFLTENLNPMNGMNRPRLGYETALNENPSFGLCIDVSHAYDYGINEVEYIVKKWKHKIKQVHFSNNRYHKDHLSFKKVGKSFLKSIEPLRELTVPIVLEEDMKFTKVNEIKEELKRVRNILGF
jgi:hypothetical protein